MTYAVRIEQFEGPLELLLQLIEKEKLDITRVSLAKVADQYLEYLERESQRSLPHLSQFLSIAARLILLKSRALLPLLTFTDEEEQSIDDLEWQLQEYRRFREASQRLGELLERPMGSVIRERTFVSSTPVFLAPAELTAKKLQDAFTAVLGEIPLMERLEEASLQSVVRLEERMNYFRAHLTERLETTFHSLTHQIDNRVELIVSFLALLQLIKERFVVVDQQEYFGDITIRHSSTL